LASSLRRDIVHASQAHFAPEVCPKRNYAPSPQHLEEENDPSCEGFTKAADNYLQAAKFFLRADDVKQADELLRRHDVLVQLVDRTKQEGRCHPVRETNNPRIAEGPTSKQPNLSPDQCEQAMKQVESLAAPNTNIASVGTKEADNAFSDESRKATTLRIRLAAQGCPTLNAKTFTKNECGSAWYDFRKNDGLSNSEANEMIGKAGCPPYGPSEEKMREH